MKKIVLIACSLLLVIPFVGNGQDDTFDFRIRTITAGVTLDDISDIATIKKAIQFLEKSKQVFVNQGYIVQTVRMSTQNLHELVKASLDDETIEHLKRIDAIAVDHNVSLSVGALVSGNNYHPQLAEWTKKIIDETSNISFSIPIASEHVGIHNKSIKTAAEVCKMLGDNSKGGEANFRFTASANCPAGIPFFPAAFHQGENSFAIGLEYPNVITDVFSASDWDSADANLRQALELMMRPIEMTANEIEEELGWKYDGIDTSPAPGLEASIGEAIETLTERPFGDVTTLSACAIITRVIKDLDIKTCGYSGLMLPVIEDRVLAARASQSKFTVEDLLLFSSVSGTGLDVIPLPGNISIETIEGIYRDVASLSLKYFNKALSARLFPIPGKQVGDMVEFDNPYLTTTAVMKLE